MINPHVLTTSLVFITLVCIDWSQQHICKEIFATQSQIIKFPISSHLFPKRIPQISFKFSCLLDSFYTLWINLYISLLIIFHLSYFNRSDWLHCFLRYAIVTSQFRRKRIHCMTFLSEFAREGYCTYMDCQNVKLQSKHTRYLSHWFIIHLRTTRFRQFFSVNFKSLWNDLVRKMHYFSLSQRLVTAFGSSSSNTTFSMKHEVCSMNYITY